MKERYYFEDDCIYDDVDEKMLVDFHDTDMYNMKSLLHRLNDYEKQLKEEKVKYNNLMVEASAKIGEAKREHRECLIELNKLRKKGE
jgi:hypothetical protein